MNALTTSVSRIGKKLPAVVFAQKCCLSSSWKHGTLGPACVLYCPHTFNCQKRTIMKKTSALRRVQSHMRAQYKKDGIEDGYEFVYCTDNIRLYKYWVPVAYFVIIGGVILSAKAIIDHHWYGKKSETREYFNIYEADPIELAYVGLGASFAFLIFILFLSSNLLIRMYYNKSTNEFIAVILKYGLYSKKMYFSPRDVSAVKTASLFGNVSVKGKRLLFGQEHFVDSQSYNIFMGYDVGRETSLDLKDQDMGKLLEQVRKAAEEKESKEFVERYKEKRKTKKIR